MSQSGFSKKKSKGNSPVTLSVHSHPRGFEGSPKLSRKTPIAQKNQILFKKTSSQDSPRLETDVKANWGLEPDSLVKRSKKAEIPVKPSQREHDSSSQKKKVPSSHEAGSFVELWITDLSRGGSGVGRDGGRVIFVPYTAPGDQVRARITEVKKHYAHAELIEVLVPAPQRVVPRCPAFGRCGGCQWQHLPYQLQWETKVKGALHALTKAGLAVSGIDVAEMPAKRIWEYRNRVQLRGSSDQLGFFKPDTRELVPVERCDIAHPLINASWEETKKLGRLRLQEFQSVDQPVGGVPGTQFRENRPRVIAPSGFYKVELEVSADGEIRRSWNASHAALGFRQVHDEQNLSLRQWIAQEVGSVGRVLDLYGGSGNLSLSLVNQVKRIDCVDTSAPSQSPHPGYHFHQMPAAKWLVQAAAAVRSATQGDLASGSRRGHLPEASHGVLGDHENCECVALIDPPRAGMGSDFPQIAASLEKLSVSRAIFVGCDVDSWVRDLRQADARGWRLQKVLFLDLFPQTSHVESIAVLHL